MVQICAFSAPHILPLFHETTEEWVKHRGALGSYVRKVIVQGVSRTRKHVEVILLKGRKDQSETDA
jgi:hypothetical protein